MSTNVGVCRQNLTFFHFSYIVYNCFFFFYNLIFFLFFFFFLSQAYILPNQPINEKTALHNFQVPVETIERASGLVMFDKIQRHKIKEVRPVFS